MLHGSYKGNVKLNLTISSKQRTHDHLLNISFLEKDKETLN